MRQQKLGHRQSDYFNVPLRDGLQENSSQFLQKSTTCQRRRNAFSIIVVMVWNRLPAEVLQAAALLV